MSDKKFYRLDGVCVLELVGTEADAILHNLTTNEIKTLDLDEGCESFVTDVRGKVLGHVYVFRTENGFRLIGAAGQSEALAAHADRYTIREDATPKIADADFVAFVVAAEHVADLAEAVDAEMLLGKKASGQAFKQSVRVDVLGCTAYQVDWLGENSWLMLVSIADAEKREDGKFEEALTKIGFVGSDEAGFHRSRIATGFPWYGVDLTAKNLPQEADRNSQTISFTKGCYLGQETVARLDALGQVQKQLVRWSIKDCVPEVGTELVANEKTVGKLTSVCETSEGAIAIGMARRSHFDVGACASGKIASGELFEAVVQALKAQ